MSTANDIKCSAEKELKENRTKKPQSHRQWFIMDPNYGSRPSSYQFGLQKVIGYVEIKLLSEDSCELKAWLHHKSYEQGLYKHVMESVFSRYDDLGMQVGTVRGPENDEQFRGCMQRLFLYELEKKIPKILGYEHEIVKGLEYCVTKERWMKEHGEWQEFPNSSVS